MEPGRAFSGSIYDGRRARPRRPALIDAAARRHNQRVALAALSVAAVFGCCCGGILFGLASRLLDL